MVSVQVTTVIFIDYWAFCKSMWDLKGYVSFNAKHLVRWIIPLTNHYHCHFHYLDFQGLVFVVVLVQAVELVVVVEFVGVVWQVVEFDKCVAIVVRITEHPIFLWFHSGLGLTQGHS